MPTITVDTEVSPEQQAAKLCLQYAQVVRRSVEAEEEIEMYEGGQTRAMYWQMEAESGLHELTEKLATLIGRTLK